MSKEKKFKELQDFAEYLNKIPEHRPYNRLKTENRNEMFTTGTKKIKEKTASKSNKKINLANIAMVFDGKKN